VGNDRWALFNVGGRLSATKVDVVAQPLHSIQVAGFIGHILVTEFEGRRHALLATGSEGIAIVDVQDPTAMQWLGNVGVNYEQTGLTFTEGGGAILYEQEVSGTHGTITALETDGTTLWIANADFGLHRTPLANLLAPGGPLLEPDGTLSIERERYTLQYAGETPWGSPLSLKLVRGKLFVALEFLGLGLFDADGMHQVGGYNLYTDVGMIEDWFLDMKVADVVQPGFLDAFTGMPDYRQVSWEIENAQGALASSGGADILTPWADFERYGKYYYNSRDVDVVSHWQRTPSRTGLPLVERRTTAYIAYGLGGLVAVDVTGFEYAALANPLRGRYLGYLPGVPAHGPDEFIGSHNENIFPHFGAGMLKEAGVVDVTIAGGKAYYTDHFAGLVLVGRALDPRGRWHGANAPYDNDNGVPGDHIPDYEFVTSFDMSPYDPEDHESLPTWMYESPARLVTGEIGGHGNRLLLLPDRQVGATGQVDALLCLGAGGLDFVDIGDLSLALPEDRFEVLAYFPTTDEIGAAPDGSPTQAIALGHTQGVEASPSYLYVADGPHGVTAWKLVDEQGYPTDDVHLVGNTVQDEYPVTVGTTTIYPATHAYGVVFDPVARAVMTLCQGVGLRRIPALDVESGLGAVGSPLLLGPDPEDIFEHNGAFGNIASMSKQDHAYDVELAGDLAYVADGGNGLTIYDLTKDPTDMESGFFVSNLGGETKQRPLLGRSTGVALWTEPNGQRMYALMAAGPYGVGVVDVSDPTTPLLVKRFEPIKLEDETVGKADGRCVDVFVHGTHAYFTYDGFGVLAYALDELVEPLPPGVSLTELWKVQNGVVLFDYRPVADGEFRLREEPGFEDLGGGALNMTHTSVDDELVLYVAYGVAGIAKLLWPEPEAPQLAQLVPTVGECTAVALSGGRLYAADNFGGLVFFK
jgi:hypothetical protein